LVTGALVTVGVLGSGATVYAATPTPQPQAYGRTIRACVGDHGQLRLAFGGCRGFEDRISWNRRGPAGPPGPAAPLLNPTPLQSVQTGSPFPVPAGAGAIAPVPGLAVNLPAAGTYLINGNVRGLIHYAAAVPVGGHSCWITADLATGTAMVPNSQRLVVLDINGTTDPEWAQATAPISMLVTVAGPTTVNVRAFSDTTGAPGACPGGADTGIYTDVNGASTINAVRIQ
jgi:hypothetical protein